ncbi:MAG TPA: TolC family protein [Methylophilus sp.]
MQCLFLQPKLFTMRLSAACLWAMLCSMTSSAGAKVSEPTVLTLQQAFNLTLQANPEIAVALREREAMQGVQAQAALRINPSLATSIQDTRSANRQTYLQLNQEIELGNKRQARMDAAAKLYNKATAALLQQQAESHANVMSAFYAVLVAQESLLLAQSSAEIATLARDNASKRVKAGKSAPVEETKASIAEVTASIALNQATAQLNSNRQRLAALWGNALPSFNHAEGDVRHLPQIATLAELSTMIEAAPAIQLAKIEIEARSALTTVERSKATPNVTVSAGFVNNQELGGINQALLGLSVPIPVFDRNQGALQEAVSRQYKAQDELAALRNQLSSHLAQQYQRHTAAKQAAEALSTQILPNAQSAFDVANKGFTAGKFAYLDVLDAQRTLFQVQTQYMQTLAEAHQALAEIERMLGDVLHHPAQN